MISIKDFAIEKGVSYEAVRKQVARYADELNGHISKVSRTQYLDDYAVEFLNEKRRNNPVVVLQESRNDEIQRLYDENRMLLIKITELQERLIHEKDQMRELQAEKIVFIESKEKLAEQEKENMRLEQELNETRRSLEAEKDMARRYESWFKEKTDQLNALAKIYLDEKNRKLTAWERITGKKADKGTEGNGQL